MNNINQYIFDIIHYVVHLRDTMEYTINKDHDLETYEKRKSVILKGIAPGTPLGKFFEANDEQTKDLREKINKFIDELYSENSKVIEKTADDKLRVDHTQHLVIFENVVEAMEQLKDIIFFHINVSLTKKEHDPEMEKLFFIEDRYYRLLATLLMIQDFQKSFMEFQKVMSESQGKPTPQSNYIVQNELAVYAKHIRSIRNRTRFTDNETLDVLDGVIRLIEMTEGRRDRVGDKPFPELFKSTIEVVAKRFDAVQPEWQQLFSKKMNEMLESLKAAQNQKLN